MLVFAVFLNLCARVRNFPASGADFALFPHPSQKWVNPLIFHNMWCGKAATLLVDHRSFSTPFPATNHFKRFFFTLHSQHFTGIDFAASRQITEGIEIF